jgi:pimeloyl-ACP methyl ester carboxylesterase
LCFGDTAGVTFQESFAETLGERHFAMSQEVTDGHLQLVLLPGLGADCRQWQPQQHAFPGLVVPSWIPPLREDTLPSYAKRLAESLPAARSMVLGGSSFGGMVALELARFLSPKAVLLIGSCRSNESLNPVVLFLRPLLRHLPRWGIRICQPIAPLGVQTFRRLSPEFRRLSVKMFQDADPEFMRWAIGAILGWAPTPLTDVPVFHIHGKRDRMIRASKVAADVTLPDAGHLLNLTHPVQVNDFISKALASVGASPAAE